MLSWQLVLLLCCWLLRLKVCCCAQHLWCCGGQHTDLVSYGMVCGQHIPAEQQVGCWSTWSIAAHLLLLRDGSTATTLLLKLSGKESFFCLGIIFPRPRWLILSASASASASAEFGCVHSAPTGTTFCFKTAALRKLSNSYLVCCWDGLTCWFLSALRSYEGIASDWASGNTMQRNRNARSRFFVAKTLQAFELQKNLCGTVLDNDRQLVQPVRTGVHT